MPPAIAPDGSQLGVVDRLKGAANVLMGTALPWKNPLSDPPAEKSREDLVKELTTWALDTRLFWKPVFDRIRSEQRFAAGKQWPGAYITRTDCKEPYIGDVVQQMVNRKTATLYAKNPEPEANRRDTMEYTVWDGDPITLEGARQTIATAQAIKQQAMGLVAGGVDVPPPPPEAEAQVAQAQAIVADYEQGMLHKALLDKIADTATRLLKREWDLQSPDLIVSMKQLVTRVLTSRVGYIKVMYRRELESPVTVEATVNGLPDDLEAMKAAEARTHEPDYNPNSAEAEKAKLLMKSTAYAEDPNSALPNEEGVIYDFLGATTVLIDKNCRNLREFVGAKRIAHEVLMSVQECEKKYKISLYGAGAAMYSDDGQKDAQRTDTKLKASDKDKESANRSKVCVWEIQDKDTGIVYVVCDGVKDFLKEPEPLEPCVKRFWTIVPVVFNCQEVEVNDPEQDVTIYPRSDIRLAMPMQIDINTAGEGLREHRVANRPCWIGIRSKFGGNAGENDLMKLASPRGAHTVLMVDSLNVGEKIADVVQPLPTKAIDEAMYSTAPSNQAMMLATGMQPADIGAQRPDEKATGQQIAAQQKATTDGSNIEDLDYALSCVAQMSWEMLIQEMPSAVVKKLVGRGAVWPDVPAERIATMNEIYLSIEAGSTGRPNQMQEVQNWDLIAPNILKYMMEAGYDPYPLLREGVKRLGDKIDLDEMFKKKLPPEPQPQKEASESISIKLSDLSPEERAQALAMAGIKAGGVVPQPTKTASTAATTKK